MQATSMLGRVVPGWIADHVASGTTTLVIAASGSAVSTICSASARRLGRCGRSLLLAAFAGIRGVRLERRADRRGGAALAAGADRRDGGRRRHLDLHGQHADAGGLRGLRRGDRPLRPGLPGVRRASAWSACRCSTASIAAIEKPGRLTAAGGRAPPEMLNPSPEEPSQNKRGCHVRRAWPFHRRRVEEERRRQQGRGRHQSGDREAAGASAARQQGRSRRGAGIRQEGLRASGARPRPTTAARSCTRPPT